MSTSPISYTNSSLLNSAAAPASSSNSSATTASEQTAVDALGNPDTFLKLLVAQLQYQDPESPADGTAFVTQLATFSGVEEQSAMRTDLDSINSVAQKWSQTQTTAAPSVPSTGNPAQSASPSGTPATNGPNTSGN